MPPLFSNNPLGQFPHFALDVLDAPHGIALGAVDSLPAQMGRTEFRRVPAPGQVLHVFFVDVFFALVAMVAARHQLLAHGGVYLQVDDFIRGRQSQQPELIIKQPLQKALPLLRRELGALCTAFDVV